VNAKTERLTPIQKTISDYLNGKAFPADSDLNCFIGMLETGEAKPSDFAKVGGQDLAKIVTDLWWHDR